MPPPGMKRSTDSPIWLLWADIGKAVVERASTWTLSPDDAVAVEKIFFLVKEGSKCEV